MSSMNRWDILVWFVMWISGGIMGSAIGLSVHSFEIYESQEKCEYNQDYGQGCINVWIAE